MSENQQIIFNYLQESDEKSLVSNLHEIEEYMECVPEEVSDAYDNLTKGEYVHVILKLTETIIKRDHIRD